MDKPAIVPQHVSFIMDGNGRWARQRGKDRIFGHFEGVESVRAVLEASVEWGIKYVSFFAFSEENWGRPEAEVKGLLDLMLRSIHNELKTFIDNGIRFRLLGDLSRISQSLRDEIKHMEEATAGGSNMTAIVFFSYSGKWDIRQAARRMADCGGSDIADYLVTAGIPDPDLLIRTSGEERISNYMLWQLAYTEFVFIDTLWPDFRKEQYLDALREYASRDRRFGKVK